MIAPMLEWMMHPLMDSIRYTGIFLRFSLDIVLVHTKEAEEEGCHA
jgi:hypothetical protein